MSLVGRESAMSFRAMTSIVALLATLTLHFSHTMCVVSCGCGWYVSGQFNEMAYEVMHNL
jgi:hypothetical protein